MSKIGFGMLLGAVVGGALVWHMLDEVRKKAREYDAQNTFFQFAYEKDIHDKMRAEHTTRAEVLAEQALINLSVDERIEDDAELRAYLNEFDSEFSAWRKTHKRE